MDLFTYFITNNTGVIARVKMELTAAFEMGDMGPISFYLGLKVDRDRE